MENNNDLYFIMYLISVYVVFEISWQTICYFTSKSNENKKDNK